MRAALVIAVLGLLAPPAQAATDAQRDRAVRWAMKQVGHREIGTTNRSALIDEWERDMRVGPARPWCGAFVHQAFLLQGVRLSARMIDPHRSVADARAGRRGLRAIPTTRVRRGDLLFFKFRAGVEASHLAIVRGPAVEGLVPTVEGNVSHAVHLKRRIPRFAVLAARVVG